MSGGVIATGTILDQILARTVVDVLKRKSAISPREIGRQAAERPQPVGLRSALAGAGVDVIAEIKRASPSRGTFPVPVDPAATAAAYLDGGAAALSVLTDGPFFQGSLADLETAAEVAHTRSRPAPVLRKDFVVDPYQIDEARASGADAVLLIVAALNDAALRDLLGRTRDAGLEALVEVHDEAEMARAAALGADLIGINNRDLRTFAVDLAVSERLAPHAPADALLIGESGIFGAPDVQRLARAGVAAVLVGEGLILASDRAAAVRAMRGEED